MTLNRRDALRTLLRTAATALGIGAALGAGHGLLEERRGSYPVRPGSTGPPEGHLIRPPGAVAERDFLAGCIRCYRCQDACAPGAIQFFTEADGKLYHSPYVDPARKACTLCMKCTQVCPTGVLRPLEPEERARVKMASVELRTDLCLSHKAKRIRDEQALLVELGREPTESGAAPERRGVCGECYMFCPLRERAIRLEPGAFLAPVVFPEHCAGCGLCEEICRVVVRGEPAIRAVPTRQRV